MRKRTQTKQFMSVSRHFLRRYGGRVRMLLAAVVVSLIAVMLAPANWRKGIAIVVVVGAVTFDRELKASPFLLLLFNC